MKRAIATILCMLLLPLAICSAQTLCQKHEVDYFSCSTRDGKIISVCGNIINEEITEQSWLQYRFGKPSAVELAYPAKKKGSIAKFEGNMFPKYNFNELRFINGNTLYGVNLMGLFSGEDARERKRVSGGVDVQQGVKSTSIRCLNSSVGKYESVFGDLNALIDHSYGQTDFVLLYEKQWFK